MRLALAALGLLLATSLFAAGGPADLVLTNGKIATVDDRFTMAQAVAIKGQRVLAVGANADIEKLAGLRTEEGSYGPRFVKRRESRTHQTQDASPEGVVAGGWLADPNGGVCRASRSCIKSCSGREQKSCEWTTAPSKSTRRQQ